MVADGLVAVYEATFETRWLVEADALMGAVSELFWDEETRAFYDTPADHEELVTRPRDVYDSAAPSGTSVATEVLLRLSLFLDRSDYRQRAEDILEELAGGMEKIPGAFGRLLCALDFSTSEPREVAVVGDPGATDTRALLDTVYSAYLPNKVVAGRDPDDDEAGGLIPLLAQRTAREGKPTAYVCVQYACQTPTTDPEELARQLDQQSRRSTSACQRSRLAEPCHAASVGPKGPRFQRVGLRLLRDRTMAATSIAEMPEMLMPETL